MESKFGRNSMIASLTNFTKAPIPSYIVDDQLLMEYTGYAIDAMFAQIKALTNHVEQLKVELEDTITAEQGVIDVLSNRVECLTNENNRLLEQHDSQVDSKDLLIFALMANYFNRF